MSGFRDLVEALVKIGVTDIKFFCAGVTGDGEVIPGRMLVNFKGVWERVDVDDFGSWVCEKLKPKWEDVPDGLDWIACDEDGSWWAFESEPVIFRNGFVPGEDCEDLECSSGRFINKNWRESVEKRPEAEKTLRQKDDERWEAVKDAIDGVRKAYEEEHGTSARFRDAVDVYERALMDAMGVRGDE